MWFFFFGVNGVKSQQSSSSSPPSSAKPLPGSNQSDSVCGRLWSSRGDYRALVVGQLVQFYVCVRDGSAEVSHCSFEQSPAYLLTTSSYIVSSRFFASIYSNSGFVMVPSWLSGILYKTKAKDKINESDNEAIHDSVRGSYVAAVWSILDVLEYQRMKHIFNLTNFVHSDSLPI